MADGSCGYKGRGGLPGPFYLLIANNLLKKIAGPASGTVKGFSAPQLRNTMMEDRAVIRGGVTLCSKTRCHPYGPPSMHSVCSDCHPL